MIVAAKLSLKEIVHLKQYDKTIFKKSAWAESVWKALCSLPHVYVVYGKDGATIFGFAVFSQTFNEVELLKWAILPSWQSAGYGSKFFQNAVRYLKQVKQVRNIFLECREDNKSAIRIYEKQGFKQIGLRKNYYKNPPANARVYKYVIKQNITLLS